MRIFWIGAGSLTVLTLVVIPYIASDRCKDRWAAYNLEAIWDYQTGCSVRIGNSLVREEYVSFDPRMPARPQGSGSAKPLDPNQALAHPTWVTLGPDNRPMAEGMVRINPR
ncbi:hypothetical protein [Bradyrhizobium stylosanthis]|uniref:Uncharacterized protein n=1 Tax=Bradyrhizobium stylosanthis TaxID=1803665 RepID=A0A560DXR6_9BRAD|nr:hypothetical protein [Bradyrhizobium stylosanthis]TWB01932.1 hypothetical protein FBZ96_103714 [Bradyrhizobium stylosanthis]